MPRKQALTGLETAASRKKLPPRPKPHFHSIARGVHLGYRRNGKLAGTWTLRVTGANEWARKIGDADDLAPADGKSTLDYWQALALARALAVAPADAADAADAAAPTTLEKALAWYEGDLLANLGDPANARRLRPHLSPRFLAMPVAVLTTADLAGWQQGLLKTVARSTANRMRSSLRACLSLAAKRDKRLAAHREVWEDLPRLPDDSQPRHAVFPDPVVPELIAACYRRDPQLGLFVETFAVCGTRPSQNARIEVADLDVKGLRLLIPKSGKGNVAKRTSRKAEKVPAPITAALAQRLAREAYGRQPDELLLRQADGSSWQGGCPYRRDFAAVVESLGLDPARFTLYGLRHTFVVRALKAGTPAAVIASQIDTSEAVLRRHYAKHLSHHSDAIARLGLLELELPTTDEKVVTLPVRR